MGSASDYLEKKVLDAVYGQTALPAIATVYVGIFTVTPDDTGSGTEATGGSYARVAVTNNTTNWPNATGTNPTVKANGAAITFPAPTGNWGTIVAWGIFDASSGGNLLNWGALSVNKTVNNGDAAPSFAIGALTIQLD